MEIITLEDVLCAYKKLKALAYHDNSDLFLRWKIAKCESSKMLDKFRDPESLLIKILENLNNNESSRAYWAEIFDEIDYYSLPKKVRTYDEHEKNKEGLESDEVLIKNIFTNQRELINDPYEVLKVTLFIDAPIEVYIISILWIMKIGYKLEEPMDNRCFGNRLVLSDEKPNRITTDERLFRPYHKQYQRWRDEGITTAKHYLDKGDDVLFINLDIKDYYYSVRIKEKNVNDSLSIVEVDKFQYLNKLFWNIHHKYTRIVKLSDYPANSYDNIKKEEYILPIGLPSSYILANWYLIDFDKRVNEFINPVYYSRYVDDIFIVTSKNDLNFDLSEKFNRIYNNSINEIPKLRQSEKYVIGLLYPVLKLVRAPQILEKNQPKTSSKKYDLTQFVFELQGYDNLHIQASKTLVYFFDSNSSKALLDKFKNEIEERSSEFRFLPDDELEKSGFDNEAYELVFEDSQDKVKTLKDYRENRYGISAHLSKKIFYTLRNGNKGTDEDIEKVLKFFKGTINLEHYRQWERLLTYLLINEEHSRLFKYVESTLTQIKEIRLSGEVAGSQVAQKEVIFTLTQQFILSLQLALSLKPKLSVPIKIIKLLQSCQDVDPSPVRLSEKPKVSTKSHRAFRFSNMVRHNYVNTPLLNYIEGADDLSLIAGSFSELSKLKSSSFNESRLRYSPRRVKFSEVAWSQCLLRVLNKLDDIGVENDFLFDNTDNDFYLNSAFDVFYKINYWSYPIDDKFRGSIQNKIFKYSHVKTHNKKTSYEVQVHELSINPEGGTSKRSAKMSSAKIGLANMKVLKENYTAAMLGQPQLDGRYKELAKVLNMAEKEKCDIIALPELALPPSLASTFLDYCVKQERCIVTGLEHWTQNNIAYNFVLTILPCNIDGAKDAIPILRLKNHYSPGESFWIREYNRVVPRPTPYRYHLFHWRGAYFAVYYCFELSDLFHRSIFKSKVDFIIASEWNQDTNYFSNIVESAARDLHCYFIQVNTNPYGDSRIVRPSKTEIKDSLRIKGGENVTLLTGEINLDKLRQFQYKGYGDQKEDADFKPTPADFNKSDVRSRQEGRSFQFKKKKKDK